MKPFVYKNHMRPAATRWLSAFFFVFSLLFFLLLVHGAADAQQTMGSVITYEDSIRHDEEEGRLLYPSFVYLEQERDEVYVIDGKNRIIIYTSDLFPLYTLGKKNHIQTPQGLTVDSKGKLYVAQSASGKNSRHRISVFRACLKWEREIYMKGFEGAEEFVPYRLAVDQKGDLYVSARYYPGVVIMDQDGNFKEILSPDEGGRKVNLTNVTIDNAGNVYLVSEEEGRIYVYDRNKKFVLKFGEKGGSTGKLSRPKAVGIDDRRGRVYVVDYMRHTVSVYDREGSYIFEFGGLGWGEGWFQFPIDITVGDTGRIFVADLFNNRVQVFNSW